MCDSLRVVHGLATFNPTYLERASASKPCVRAHERLPARGVVRNGRRPWGFFLLLFLALYNCLLQQPVVRYVYRRFPLPEAPYPSLLRYLSSAFCARRVQHALPLRVPTDLRWKIEHRKYEKRYIPLRCTRTQSSSPKVTYPMVSMCPLALVSPHVAKSHFTSFLCGAHKPRPPSTSTLGRP